MSKSLSLKRLILKLESKIMLSGLSYDLVTPDGTIDSIQKQDPCKMKAEVVIRNIDPNFKGFEIDRKDVHFNLKSTLAQIGLEAILEYLELKPQKKQARISIELLALGALAKSFLELLQPGIYVGKLFAADPRRKVRDPEYLLRMFSREDRLGRPLLSLGGSSHYDDFILEKIEERTVAFLNVQNGVIQYQNSIKSFLPTLEKALHHPEFSIRKFLHLHQVFQKEKKRAAQDQEMLLLKTSPLHIRTVFAMVLDEHLPQGYKHTKANILQPDTYDSGDIYEFYGKSDQIIDHIPLEFFTLEPHKEYVFFSDRDQLQACLEDKEALFKAFETAPEPKNLSAATFVVKGERLKALKKTDWIAKNVEKYEFPGISHPSRQTSIVQKYIQQQPAYLFLKAIEEDHITSQGILLSRFFPTPFLKRLLLSNYVQRCLKRIYFQQPSYTFGDYFSYEDRAFLVDLAKFGIPVFWADKNSKKILQYVLKPDKDTGMFVPLNLVESFRKATTFGVYGSNLKKQSHYEKELQGLLQGILEMKRNDIQHSLLSDHTPIALVTGGGPGVMEEANQIAKSLKILSCANIVDFRKGSKSVVNEQKTNPFIDAKMTYRLDHLVERQAEFHLDFPIFLPGGIGMDFEYTLEEVRRKTGSSPATPVILFGEVDYWKKKVTSRFQCNRQTGLIQGSEWVSNCFYCAQTAEQALWVYEQFFKGELKIGNEGPIYDLGFCALDQKP